MLVRIHVACSKVPGTVHESIVPLGWLGNAVGDAVAAASALYEQPDGIGFTEPIAISVSITTVSSDPLALSANEIQPIIS